MIMPIKKISFLMVVVFTFCQGFGSTIQTTNPGTRIITTNGYDNCIEISNAICRVVLEPNLGGRVLIYEINGKNALYIDPKQNGVKFAKEELEAAPNMQPCAGRFDIGPEQIKPNTKVFWQGQWTGEITGKFSARMTSQIDTKTGIQVIRDFKLDAKSSKLKIKQTILNQGAEGYKLCFWSRTFATGGGIFIAPLTKPNRFPKGFISYGDGSVMKYKPEPEENILVKDDTFVLLGPTVAMKYVFDNNQGWMGYITKDDLLFVKTYDYKKNSEYGEMTASSLSLFYKAEILAELEPIGPWEWVAPNKKTSYSETWHLLPYQYPQNKTVDVGGIKNKVKALN
jgi:hypothetical protein